VSETVIAAYARVVTGIQQRSHAVFQSSREYDFVTQSHKFTCGKPEELINFRVRQLMFIFINYIVGLCEREDKCAYEHKNSGP